ncbi:hypothetical protein CAPTEDRAFT_185685 [Capitella teleta]|uniref:Uncharacterized protein n=1 Tax=Capitella teleta TaxID=283909 RepID=R7UEN2_CAPTE|nr:hypothetical protein CAPTEDRAFT_185685 [Capitella teleta]|eukprot:ELU01737.1 hypothetical protein CAPTEDRAFT_185685 [Capitella teleta]
MDRRNRVRRCRIARSCSRTTLTKMRVLILIIALLATGSHCGELNNEAKERLDVIEEKLELLGNVEDELKLLNELATKLKILNEVEKKLKVLDEFEEKLRALEEKCCKHAGGDADDDADDDADQRLSIKMDAPLS